MCSPLSPKKNLTLIEEYKTASHYCIHEKTQWWTQSVERCRHTLYIGYCIDTFYALKYSLFHIYRKTDLDILFFSLFTEGLVQRPGTHAVAFFCGVSKVQCSCYRKCSFLVKCSKYLQCQKKNVIVVVCHVMLIYLCLSA